MAKPMPHDPQAILDYYVDWRPWLAGAENDTIATSTWVTATAGVTLHTQAVALGITRTWVTTIPTVAGLVLVINHIVTAAGRADQRTLRLVVQQR